MSGQIHVHLKASAARSEYGSSRDHTHLSRLSLALAMVLTMNAQRFQRAHLLRDMGSLLNTSKDTGMGVIDLAHICGFVSAMDAVCTTVFGSYRTLQWLGQLALVLNATHVLVAKVRSSDVCSVGDTRQSFSEKW